MGEFRCAVWLASVVKPTATSVFFGSTIIDIVQETHVIVRCPTWITAGFAQRYAGAGGRTSNT